MRDIFLEEAKNWGNADALSNCLALTDQISDAHTTQEPTRLNFILMALCLKGQAKYNIDTKEQTVKAGDLLFISERHIVDNYSASADFECLCIMVSTEFYHGFVQSVQNVSSLLLFSMNNPVVALTPSEVQVFSNYFHTIREKITNTGHHYRENLVKALLLAQFIRLLEQNFRSIRRVSWYAEQLFITPKYLSEVVKQTSKRTPNEWIDSYVILEARVLLKTTTMSIKEIADELHFPSQSFLGKYFKEHVGVSPSEFRNH